MPLALPPQPGWLLTDLRAGADSRTRWLKGSALNQRHWGSGQCKARLVSTQAYCGPHHHILSSPAAVTATPRAQSLLGKPLVRQCRLCHSPQPQRQAGIEPCQQVLHCTCPASQAAASCHSTEPRVRGGGGLRSFSQAYLHVHRTFLPETDRTTSEILPTTATLSAQPETMHGAEPSNNIGSASGSKAHRLGQDDLGASSFPQPLQLGQPQWGSFMGMVSLSDSTETSFQSR